MSTRLKSLLLIAVVLVLPIPGKAAQTPPFLSPLHLGVVSDEVLDLQKVLNADPDTRLTDTGPGSPGQESRYFGPLTKKAVIRFQEKYAPLILYPNHLISGTGVVGPTTRLVLNTQSIAVSHLPATISSTVPSSSPLTAISPVPITLDMQVQPGVNPNIVNFDFAMQKLKSDGEKRGVSDTKITEEIGAIKEIVATTTDLHKEFFTRFGIRPKTASQIPSLSLLKQLDPGSRSFFLKILSVLGLGDTAYAQEAETPFGGYIVFMFPCTCSLPTWHIFIDPPLPPSYAEELDAVEEDQLFESYNIPLVGTALLGFYVPGAPTCYIYVGTHCNPVEPTWGLVAPFVGSSPL